MTTALEGQRHAPVAL